MTGLRFQGGAVFCASFESIGWVLRKAFGFYLGRDVYARGYSSAKAKAVIEKLCRYEFSSASVVGSILKRFDE